LQISVHPIRSHFEFSRFPYTAEYFYKVKLSRENKTEIRTWKKNYSRLNRLFLILVTDIFIFYYLFELIENIPEYSTIFILCSVVIAAQIYSVISLVTGISI